MRPRAWLPTLVTLVSVLGVCAGCADPSRESDAGALADEIDALPGVTDVRLDYTEPVTLDSGKVALKVTMGASATPDEVTAVAETAYDAFSGIHDGEEADLSLRAGETTLHLRSFEPEASVEAVGDAVRTGLEAAPPGGSVAIDLTTQDVPRGDHVAGTYLVALPAGSTFADVPTLLNEFAADHDDDPLIGWGGGAADGSSLAPESGFAPDTVVDRWLRLQEAGPRLVVRTLEDGTFLTEGRLAERYDVRDPADQRALDRVTHPQLRVLGEGSWTYAIDGPHGPYLASIDRFVCEPTSEGPYDDRLEAWVMRELGPCPRS